MGRFDEKVAIITGGTAGIGLAIAERLGAEGATVVIASRRQKNIDAALQQLQSQNIKAYGIACHSGKAADIKKLIDFTISKCSKIDILVANAATNPFFGHILHSKEAEWDKIYQVNLKGVFLLCQAAIPFMPKGSSIIMNSSIGGYLVSNPLGIYNVMKTALIGLTRLLAESVADKGIRVNGIAPGLIPTKFSKALTASEVGLEMFMKQCPMKRTGKPEECASVVAFLASDDASYVTGETIVVAGGQRARL
mmetsp:Transcript_22151/g.35528  ORF Transcript_22151/g.35528 Transcript_22151/m.35528 type:complete len:251 (-) Transcript_22151:480-1232(-)|eukprot:CAMPEP_0197046148 /NCGR_PEP_ID=MMETSP1384-20130603/21898_1 /TAXON_ID=29189 /ORGANISM="Ammonia sp." /LENGTH=250 /DNA_ID=CAMNT_0042477879 /DNA_START=43 /DNA_END=795 /DNA_ORIENTATION=-